MEIFKEPLKPKFHFLVHYPTIIERNGPIYAISCLRFEAKHKEFKEYARVVRPRRNICYTLAQRHQLSFATKLQVRKGFQNRIKFGKIKLIENFNQLPDYELFKSFVTEDGSDKYKYVFSSAMINGISYKTDMLLIIGEDNDLPQFGKIQCILSDDKRDIAFLVLNMRTKSFITHIYGLSIEDTTKWDIISYQNLYHRQPSYLHSLADGKICASC